MADVYPVKLRDIPQPSSLLFFLQFSPSFPEISAAADQQYWATIQLLPNASSLNMFVRESDKQLFISNADNGLAHLNSILHILYDASQYPPRSYSLQEINWSEHALTKVKCRSGALNAMFLMSVI